MTSSRAITPTMGAYLHQFAWSHWVTLTPRFPDCHPRRLVEAFKDRFIRKLAKAAQHPVTWFYVMERSQGRVYHLHALLGGTETLSAERVRQSWELGISQVARYSPFGGASRYLVKTLWQPDEQWEHFDLSRRMPARLLDPIQT